MPKENYLIDQRLVKININHKINKHSWSMQRLRKWCQRVCKRTSRKGESATTGLSLHNLQVLFEPDKLSQLYGEMYHGYTNMVEQTPYKVDNAFLVLSQVQREPIYAVMTTTHHSLAIVVKVLEKAQLCYNRSVSLHSYDCSLKGTIVLKRIADERKLSLPRVT